MGWLQKIFGKNKSVDTDPLRPEGNYISPDVPRKIVVERAADANDKSIKFDIKHLRIPDNQVLIEDFAHSLEPGDRAMLVGPSGSGKSTLFRSVANLWPYGEGRIELPLDAHVMVLPQKPHLPLLDLHGVLAYPREDNPYTREDMEEMLDLVGLEWLKDVLDKPHVNGAMLENTLSGGEKQRLAFARLFLAKPEIVFLDECTSALDVDWQAKMYDELMKRLPDSIVISISHRAELKEYHKTSLTLGRDKKIRIEPIDQVDDRYFGDDADTPEDDRPKSPPSHRSPKPPKP